VHPYCKVLPNYFHWFSSEVFKPGSSGGVRVNVKVLTDVFVKKYIKFEKGVFKLGLFMHFTHCIAGLHVLQLYIHHSN